MNEVITDLIKYKKDMGFNVTRLHQELRSAGIMVQYDTVRGWVNRERIPLTPLAVMVSNFLDNEHKKYSNGGGI